MARKRSGPLPFFKAYPSNFLSGCLLLTAEQKGVYYTLLFLLYDRWEPIDDSTLERRRYMAQMCGISIRKMLAVIADLLRSGKLHRRADGRLSNSRFDREMSRLDGSPNDQAFEIAEGEHAKVDVYRPVFEGVFEAKKHAENAEINGDLNGPTSNGNKDLGDPSRARGTRIQNLDSTVPGSDLDRSGDLSQAAEQVIEQEITMICRAIGVDLTASTKRHGWPAQWVRMRTELNITVADMVAAIDSYPSQFKGDSVRSLGLFKDRAIEKRQARDLGDRIGGRVMETKAVAAAAISVDDWTTMLTTFIRIGSWERAKFGPSPLEDGCIVPITMLDKAERYWIKNNNHPEFTLNSGGRVPWHAGIQHGSVTEITPFYRSRSKS